MRGYQRGIWQPEIEAGLAVTGTGTRFPTAYQRRSVKPHRSARKSAFPRRNAPEVLRERWPSKDRGRRESRVRAAPAVSRAICTTESAHEHTGSAESIRPSLRNGFTAYFVLSPVNGLSCHRRCAGMTQRNLTPASGRQDHTTSPSASATFVFVTSASTASHRAFVTIATRPSFGWDARSYALDLPVGVK